MRDEIETRDSAGDVGRFGRQIGAVREREDDVGADDDGDRVHSEPELVVPSAAAEGGGGAHGPPTVVGVEVCGRCLLTVVGVVGGTVLVGAAIVVVVTPGTVVVGPLSLR